MIVIITIRETIFVHLLSRLWWVGLSLICAYLTKTIPEITAGLISGTSNSGGSTIGVMAGAGLGAATGASSLVGNGIGPPKTGVGDMLGGIGRGFGEPSGAREIFNASRMTGDNSKSANTPKYHENPRVTGGTPRLATSGQSNGKSFTDFAGRATANAAKGSLKNTGILSAFSVPGMENADKLNLNSLPEILNDDMKTLEFGNSQSNKNEEGNDVANTISAEPDKTKR
ncbi:hypothetical protein [Bartonella sp. CB178]|uniref:hypothetical protein n=1 Tax=Bartonella sp. CB178 TaxID=3112255 RepID=UPI00300DE0BE